MLLVKNVKNYILKETVINFIMNWENKFWGTYTDYELDMIVNDDSLLDAYRYRAEQEQLKRFKSQ